MPNSEGDMKTDAGQTAKVDHIDSSTPFIQSHPRQHGGWAALDPLWAESPLPYTDPEGEQRAHTIDIKFKSDNLIDSCFFYSVITP